MAVIVGFLIVHVALALLVPKTLWAMVAGGPRLLRSSRARHPRTARPRDMRSPFRPDVVPDAAILDDHKPLIRSLERRGLIRGGLSLGALVMLTGCDVKRPEAVESALLAISRFNDGVQALLFDPNKLAPTYPASMILRPPKFNAYYDVMDVKPVNGADLAPRAVWPHRRQASVDTAADCEALPQTSMVIKHICVEGWSYIGGWSGPYICASSWSASARISAPNTSPSRRPTTIRAASTWRRRCIRRHCWRPSTAATRSPIRLDIRYACAWRPSSDTKTQSGSQPSRSRTLIPGDTGKTKGFPWFAGI